jgi:hypothetical protein
MRSRNLVLALVMLAGCGESPAGSADASTKDAAADRNADVLDAAKSDACVSPKEGCGFPCPGDFASNPLPTVAAKSVCTPAEISALWATCVADTGSAQACSELIATKTACLACLIGTFDAGPALVRNEDGTVRPNVGACLTEATTPSCGQHWEDVRQCAEFYCRNACAPDLQCEAKARTGYCAEYTAKVCPIEDGGAGSACLMGGSDEARYLAVAGIMCGGGGTKDAGGD